MGGKVDCLTYLFISPTEFATITLQAVNFALPLYVISLMEIDLGNTPERFCEINSALFTLIQANCQNYRHWWPQTSVPCTSLHVPIHPCTSLYTPVRPCTSLHVPVYPCTSLHVPVYPCASLYIPARPCTYLYVPVSPCTDLYAPLCTCTSLYVPVRPCTYLYVPVPILKYVMVQTTAHF